jgi:hypothetical protein
VSAVLLSSDGTNWIMNAGQQDTGWVNLSLGSGATAGSGFTPAARLRGTTVSLRGALVLTSSSTIGSLPGASYAPAATVKFPMVAD